MRLIFIEIETRRRKKWQCSFDFIVK